MSIGMECSECREELKVEIQQFGFDCVMKINPCECCVAAKAMKIASSINCDPCELCEGYEEEIKDLQKTHTKLLEKIKDLI